MMPTLGVSAILQRFFFVDVEKKTTNFVDASKHGLNINVRNDLILFHILKVYVKFSQRRRDDGGNRHYECV